MASRNSFLSSAYTAARAAGLSEPAARVAATQAAHESAYGKSAPGNNFFGIKAGKSWKGSTQKLNTWEVIDGVKTKVKDTFRKYSTPEQSFKDWKALVGRRWPGVLTAQTFEEAVAALKAGLPGGYATDPDYAAKLAATNNRLTDALQYAMPDEMAPPSTETREQALAALENQQAQQQAIAAAYNDPMRALDTVPSGPPSNLAPAPVGSVERAPLGPVSPPSSFPSRPGVVGSLPAAPQSSFPARPGVPGALPGRPPSSFPARPTGPTGALPAASFQSSFPSRPEVAGALPAARPQSSFPARPEVPGSLPAATQPSTAALAAQYGAYRSPTGYAGVKNQIAIDNAQKAPTGAPVSIAGNPTPSSLENALGIRNELENIKDAAMGPVASTPPPVETIQATPVLAPLMPQPVAVKQYNVAEVPQAPAMPSLRPSDIYGGAIGTAIDNTGLNTVARSAGDPNMTTVTNQFGATTGMKNGYQTAVGSMPSIPGISGPGMKNLANQYGKPMAVGGMIGGLPGLALGALYGALSKGGALSGSRNIDTSKLGGLLGMGNTTAFAKPQYGGIYSQFPDAPSRPAGSNGGAWGSEGARQAGYGLSPGAAAAIDRGQGGLY